MKRTVFLIALSLAAFCTRAQYSPVQFGLKGGLNISSISNTNLSMPKYDPRYSFNAGGLIHIHIVRHIALQPELLYSGQGAVQRIGGVNYRTNLNYINFPMLIQFMIGDGFRIETGPQPSFRVSAKQQSAYYSESDVTKSFETYDVSWILGASYLFPSGFGMDARFNSGLANIYTGSNAVMKSQVFQLGIFYQCKPIPMMKKAE